MKTVSLWRVFVSVTRCQVRLPRNWSQAWAPSILVMELLQDRVLSIRTKRIVRTTPNERLHTETPISRCSFSNNSVSSSFSQSMSVQRWCYAAYLISSCNPSLRTQANGRDGAAEALSARPNFVFLWDQRDPQVSKSSWWHQLLVRQRAADTEH